MNLKRIRQMRVIPLLLVVMVLFIGLQSNAVAASVLTAPDGGYYNVPTEGKLNDSSIYEAQISIPEGAQKGDGFVTKNFTTFLVDCSNSILNFFGLHSIDQLARSTTHLFWGALDTNDVKIISMVVIPMIAVAWTVAAVSFKWFSVKLALSTMNPRKRARILEFFGNWFIGALLLTFGIQLVNLIFQASSIFTETFLAGIPGGTFNAIQIANFGDGFAKAKSGLAMAFFSLAVVGVTFAINLIYLQRYVMMLIYASLSPLFFTYYFFDTTRDQFWNWIRNLITLAFMPAVHSLMMYLFTVVTYVGDNYLLRLVFLILFIGITESILNLGGLSAGTGGIGNHVLTGLGLGITMSGMRGLGGMFSVLGAGGGSEGALLASGLNQGDRDIGRPGEKVAGGRSWGEYTPGTSSVLSGSNQSLSRTQAFVNHARNVGSRVGAVAGGVGGAVMGAATGNMGMMALGGMVGSTTGSKVGAASSQKVAGVGAVQGQILGEQMMNKVSRGEAKENLFGAGPNLPQELEEFRPQITEANIAGIQGAMPRVYMGSSMGEDGMEYEFPQVSWSSPAQMNKGLAGAIASKLSSVDNITPQEGDRAFSRAFADHTEYYYQPAGQSPMLVDYTAVGDKMAGTGRAIETVQEYKGRKDDQGNLNYNWHDVKRVSVSPNESLGNPGVPWTWNTRKSILSEA